MRTVVHNYDEIHSLVDSTPGAFWDGFTAVFFTPDRRGMKSGIWRADGMRRVGRWGIATRVDLSDDGTWEVPNRVVASRSRN